jgi:hypothetical protein
LLVFESDREWRISSGILLPCDDRTIASSLHFMTPSAPDSDAASDLTRPPVSEDAVRRLAQAIAGLANDADYFLDALTEMLLAMQPISGSSLSDNEVRFLIESGAFTADEWAATSAAVARGGLQMSATETWLLNLLATKSLADVTGFLGWTDEDVRRAVAEGKLYAVEICGRLRFPSWQLDAGSPTKLLPGLDKVIAVIDPRWRQQSAAGFMETPQEGLVAEGRKTPVQWLRDGGDVSTVIQIVEASDWS